jgi:hypothetical protein
VGLGGDRFLGRLPQLGPGQPGRAGLVRPGEIIRLGGSIQFGGIVRLGCRVIDTKLVIVFVRHQVLPSSASAERSSA